MNAVIFLGPTLTVEEARKHLDANYCPPVAQGDVLRALSRNPLLIGIVDGYFETVPAVWHKEILLAMQRGVHVFGSGRHWRKDNIPVLRGGAGKGAHHEVRSAGAVP